MKKQARPAARPAASKKTAKPRPAKKAAVPKKKRVQEEKVASILALDWPVVEPKEGEFDVAAIDALLAQIVEVKAAGSEPVLALHDRRIPEWFDKAGGWSKPGNQSRFIDMCLRLTGQLDRHLDHYISFLDPTWISTYGPVVSGKVYIPGYVSSIRMLRNMLNAHFELYKHYQETERQLGILSSVTLFLPEREDNDLDRQRAEDVSYRRNFLALDCLSEGKILKPLGKDEQVAQPSLDRIWLSFSGIMKVRFSWFKRHFARLEEVNGVTGSYNAAELEKLYSERYTTPTGWIWPVEPVEPGQ